MSKRRVGVEGLEPEGELYENSRRRLGVEGAVVALDEEALGRTGETGRRGEGGVTSVWSMDANIAFACSVAMVRQQMERCTNRNQNHMKMKIGHEEIITPRPVTPTDGESEGLVKGIETYPDAGKYTWTVGDRYEFMMTQN